jgi:hypothetical protein
MLVKWLIRIGLIIVIVLFIIAFIGLSFTLFSSWIKTKYFFIEKKSFKSKNKKFLKRRLFAEIDKHMYAYTVDVIFLMFCYFYETNYNDIQNFWMFEEEAFPNGNKDLEDLYKWITEDRVKCKQELTSFKTGSIEELSEVNRLFDLDTEKAKWIIERRKYLML